MTKTTHTTLRILAALMLVGMLLIGCDTRPRTVVGEKDSPLVISELMASNQTGIVASDGRLHDWLEVQNRSERPIALGGYMLSRDSGRLTWTFPDTIIRPQECMLIFAADTTLGLQLACGFHLPRKGATIQLLRDDSTVLSTLTYTRLKADQAIRLTKKGRYKKTYRQSPSYAGGDKGHRAYLDSMAAANHEPLLIWEYMNRYAAPRTNNETGCRWVELKNVSGESVDLTPYYLASSSDSLTRIDLPRRTLAPGDLILVEDRRKRLSGPCLKLFRDGRYVDGVNAHKTHPGVSIGRLAGRSGFYYFSHPSPEKENADTAAFDDIADAPRFITQPGSYPDEAIDVSLKAKGCRIYYTTDGRMPTLSSDLYEGPIRLSRTTVVRAIAVDSTSLQSPVATATYVLGVDHKLPIVSLVVDSLDLYDYHTGIYAEGPNANEESPHKGANYWRPWEKMAHIEFVDGQKGFSETCGIKIFGAYSRARDKKSFQVKFRHRYGRSHVDYDLYRTGQKEESHGFVLRSGSQDDRGVMVRDEFFTRLMAESSPTLAVQRYRPVVLYLNGKYFGVYYIREKINRYYVARLLNVDPTTVSILQGTGREVNCGSSADYFSLMAYVRNHNMRTSEAFAYVDQHIDLQNLIDYKIGEFYTGNADVGNIRFFRSTDPRGDQKWRWLYYDLDWGFYKPLSLGYYVREGAVRPNGEALALFNFFVSRLLPNPEFRRMFIERWAYHYSHTFEETHALALFDEMIEEIRPEMERNCKRWPKMGMRSWEKNVANFRAKIKAAPARLHRSVISELGITKKEQSQYFAPKEAK